jgi:Xaa-Pro aminopeptidase
MAADDLLIFADKAECADLRYALGMLASAPLVYLRLKGRGYALLGDADLERGRQQAGHCRVLSLSRYLRGGEGAEGPQPATLAAAIHRLAAEKGARRLLVPSGFPLGLARELRRLKIRVKPRGGEFFFPEREIKSANEIEMIRAALVMGEVGMAEAIHALRNAKINPRGGLTYRGSPLTSEKLRSIIQVAVFQAGGTVSRAVVADGRHAGAPTQAGSGPLHANQPILLGIAPRSHKTGYHAEITRTVVRGRATDAVRDMNAALCRVQEAVLGLMREGARASAIHLSIRNQLAHEGFRSGRCRGMLRGQFHATGQGIGLDLDEPPRLSAASRAVLRSGHVLSVGPGLYYPEAGGVRLTDLLVVTRNGARNLTQFERVLEV